ncbi:Multi antimicrobial extrusion protein [Metarhizium guizhouense ARSEF 977]|uniref:Multi antimicrobial extrusion protein n=1 Tax=Metarhizium guizhouense (strain ARSEF 977) TaxID=1276136 RepID=A0A0B4GRA7_METGA|nr:Multi antimicrobial extrusion protein [Metarhizium guizhouense ARSEF 977]
MSDGRLKVANHVAKDAPGIPVDTGRRVSSQKPKDEGTLTTVQDADQPLPTNPYIPSPKHHGERRQSMTARICRSLFRTKAPSKDHEEDMAVPRQPTETSPLLNGIDNSGPGPRAELLDEWQGLTSSHRTTWQQEGNIIVAYSTPLIITFLLQYSITVTSVFAVGRIGKIELGAMSLANISLSITCLTPFQGLATSLDTLCAQAYGSGHKYLVGLQCQRMTAMLLALSGPVAVLWIFSERILAGLVPDPETARLAAVYLRILVFAIPGIVIFETGKRFLQAQGLFRATTYILLTAAPINVFVHWLLVWQVGLGFVGAAMAATITLNLLPLLLVLYVLFIGGSQCWGGLSKRAFTNWWVIIRLALPGMIMVEAEWFIFEIITVLASRFGTEYLAAQSILSTLTSIFYQIPFPLSIAASTRVANLIGAGRVDDAKTAARVAIAAACIVALFNILINSSLRYHLPVLFTNDRDVIAIVGQTLPLVAIVQVFDGISAGAHGLLRGIGKQFIGGPVNLFAYYAISLPISLALAFKADWKLAGMWAGIAVGLVVVSVIEYTYLLRTDWHQAVAEAEDRNEAG